MLASSQWGAIERRCNRKGINRRPSATMDSLYPRSSDAATTTLHPASRSAFASDRRCDQKYHSELTTSKMRRFIRIFYLPKQLFGLVKKSRIWLTVRRDGLAMKQRLHMRGEINTNHQASLSEGTATLILVPTTP